MLGAPGRAEATACLHFPEDQGTGTRIVPVLTDHCDTKGIQHRTHCKVLLLPPLSLFPPVRGKGTGKVSSASRLLSLAHAREAGPSPRRSTRQPHLAHARQHGQRHPAFPTIKSAVLLAEGGERHCGHRVCRTQPGHSPDTAQTQPRCPGALPARSPGPAGTARGDTAARGDPPRITLLLTDLPIIIIIIFLFLLLLPLQVQQHISVLHTHGAEVAVPRARSQRRERARPEPRQPRGGAAARGGRWGGHRHLPGCRSRPRPAGHGPAPSPAAERAV